MPHATLRRAGRFAVLGLVAALATCTDNPAGPGHGGRAYLAIEPTLSSSVDLAAFGLVIDSLRLVIVRPAADTLVDTTLFFDPDSSQIDFSSPLTLHAAAETLQVSVVMSAGGIPLFSGTQNVAVTVGGPGATPPVTIPLSFSGPGVGVTALHIAPADSVITLGDSLRFRVTADSAGVPITLFYVAWLTADTTRARINAFGRVRAPIHRDTITVFARTPTGVRDSTVVTFVPVPTSLVTADGAGQTGPVGAPLGTPLRVRVTAADGLGVKGVAVQFSVVAGGGSIAGAPVATDTGGYAQTTATLGTATGANVFSASAAGLTVVAFNATAVAGAATAIAVVSGGSQTDTVGKTLAAPFVVRVTDAFTNPVSGARVAWAVASGVGTTSADTTTTVAGGQTQVTLHLGTTPGVDSVRASLVGTSATTAFGATALVGAPAQLAFVTQPGNAVAGVAMVPAPQVALRDQYGNQTAATSTVTIGLGANPGGATLSGTTSVAAVAGVATFANLVLDKVATSYTLVATSAALTSPASATFNLAAGAASAATSVVSIAAGTIASGGTDTVTLQAKDALGNARTIGGDTVAFSLATGGGISTATLGAVTDHGNGMYSAPVTGVLAGTAATVHATINGTAVTSALPMLTVTPGAVSAATSVVSVGTATLISGTGTTVTLQAKDAAGNLLTTGGAVVTFSDSGGTSTGTLGVVSYNGNGTYTAPFTGVLAGTATTIHAKVNGTAVTTSLPTIVVIPGLASAAASLVTVSAGVIASGTATTVTLTAKDAAGNDLTAGGDAVVFGDSGGTSTGTFGTVVDHVNGTYTNTFTGVKAGTATPITATINGAAVTTPLPTVTVGAGLASAATSVVTVAADTIASGTATTVTLTAKDAAGNILTSGGDSVAFSFTGGASTGSIGTVTDHSNGTYSATFTGVLAGAATTLHATLNGSAVATAPPTVTVTPGAVSVVTSPVTISSGIVAAGATATATLTAKDAAGNSLTTGGATVVFSISGGTSTGAFSPSPATDHANGTYSATFMGVAAGTAVLVGATINGIADTTALPSLTVVPGNAVTAQSIVSVSSASVASGAVDTLKLQARDSLGNNLTSGGLTVVFSFSGGSATGTIGATTDHGDGTYTALFTGVLAGSTTVHATINASPVTSTLPTLSVTPGAGSAATSVVTTGVGALLSGAGTVAILQAKDAAGNSLTTGGDTVAFTQSGVGTVSIGSAADNGNGTYTASLTGVVAGSLTIGARLNGSAVTSTAALTVTASGIDTATSIVTVSRDTLPSGLLDTVTLVAKDAAGNILTLGGDSVAFSFTGGTSTGSLGAVTDHGNGTYTATFLGGVAGNATTIHATINGAAVTTAAPTITVTPGAITSVIVTPGGATLDALGTTQLFSAVAHDSAGNIVTTAFTWTVVDGAVAFVTSPGGLATALGNGTTSIRATATGGVFGTATLTVAQLVTQVQVLPSLDTVHAINNSRAFSAVAKDASDSVVAGQSFTWTSSDTLIAKVNGSGVALAVGAGTDTITATTAGVSGKATLVIAQVVASVVVAPDTVSLSVGLGQFFTATAKDSNGITVPDASFTWASSNPLIATVSVDGLATTIGVGVDTITATADGVVGRAELRVISTVHTADILADSVWTAAQSPHIVRGYLKIASGATLTIQPGAVVKFDTASGLQVGDSLALGGGLILDGATLTVDSTAVRPGYWRGIEIQQANGPLQLRHFTLEGAGGLPAPLGLQSALLVRATGADIRIDSARIGLSGGHGLAVFGGKPSALRIVRSTVTGAQASGMVVLAPLSATDTIASDVLTGNLAYPLAISAGALPALGTNAFTGNGRDTLLLAGGMLTGSAVLPAVPGVKWRVTAPVSVDSGGALRVTDAQTVFFDSTAGIMVGDSAPAAFDVTPNGPTLFTVTPGQGSWSGILFANLAKDDTLRSLILERAGVLKCYGGVIIGGFQRLSTRLAPKAPRAPSLSASAPGTPLRDVIIGGCELPTALGAVQYYNTTAATLLLDSVTVRDAPSYALEVFPAGGGPVAVKHGQFYNNTYQSVFNVGDGLSLSIDSSDIYHYGTSSSQPVFAFNYSADSVTARNNWWGDVAGPGADTLAAYSQYRDSIGRAILVQPYAPVAFAPFATAPYFATGAAATVIATPDSLVPDVMAGAPLPDSIRARAIDAQGRGAGGAAITWGTGSGSGSINFLSNVGDAGGRVGAVWLPPTVTKLDTAFAGLAGPSARFYLNVLPGFATAEHFTLASALTEGIVSADSTAADFTSTGRHGVLVTHARDAFGNVATPSVLKFDDVPGTPYFPSYGTIDSMKADSVFFTVSSGYPSTFQIRATYPIDTLGNTVADSVILTVNQVGVAVQIRGFYGYSPTDSVTFNSICPSSGPFNSFCQRPIYAYVVDSAGAPLQSNPGYIPAWHPLVPGDTTVGIPLAYVNNFVPPINAQMNGSTAIVVDIISGPALAIPSDTLVITVQQVVGKVALSPDTISTGIGDTVTFHAFVADSGGYPMPTQQPVAWTINPPYDTTLTVIDSAADSLRVRFDRGVWAYQGYLTSFVGVVNAHVVADSTLAGQGTMYNPIHYEGSGVGPGPAHALVDPLNHWVGVINRSGNSITMTNTATNTKFGPVLIGTLPIWGAVDPMLNRMYVANNIDGTVSVIGEPDTVVKTVSVGGPVYGMAVDSATHRAFVGVRLCTGTPTCTTHSYIVPIDGTSDTLMIADTVLLGADTTFAPQGLAWNKGNGRLYVGRSDGVLQIVDGGTFAVLDSVVLAPGYGINDVAINDSTNTIYATSTYGQHFFVIDGGTLAFSEPFPTNTPGGVSVDVRHNKVYFGSISNTTVTVVDGANPTNYPYVVVGTSVSDVPVDAAVDQITGTVYAPHTFGLAILQFYGTKGPLPSGVAPLRAPIATAPMRLTPLLGRSATGARTAAPLAAPHGPASGTRRNGPLAIPALPRAKTPAKAPAKAKATQLPLH